ncbi:hypothetical protein [uncultured Neptuniibacter sp.]|uniref:hypothetical protein n=1 Tax=uncultured Neptuniibacter sp. TaxID=502143 RepID=UPI00262ED123|nr:hypothetical protein [uncultured Neptuniibacter sp.]
MEIKGLQQVETTIDFRCDLCGDSCKQETGVTQSLEFGTLNANWGYASKHDGESYNIHFCEDCFFQTLANLREARRGIRMFDQDFDPLAGTETDPLAEK